MNKLFYSLRRHAAAGLCAIAALSLVPSQANADWLRAESNRFVVYSEGSERELREMVTQLEHFDYVLRLFMGVSQETPTHRKLPIYITSARGLKTVLPDATENLAGFYHTSDEDIFAIATNNDNFRTLKHEYAHHFMKSEFHYPYPGWYVEGFAEYYATIEFTRNRTLVGKPDPMRGMALHWVTWMPLNELLANRPLIRTRNSDSYYPMAWLLTHWFHGNPQRRVQLNTYLRDVGEGGDPVEAMERATGMSADELRLALRRYKSGRIPYVGFESERPAIDMNITRLSSAADDLLLLGQNLKMTQSEENRAAALARIRREAAKHPQDPLALLVHGHAELHNAQTPDVAEAIFERLLAIDPNHVEGLQYMARISMERADSVDNFDDEQAHRRRAQTYLGRAFAADDANYITFTLLAENRWSTPGFPTDNDLETLALAYMLAPQLDTNAIRYAQALMFRDRHAEAVPMLQIVANNPHNRSDSIRELLRQARGLTEDELNSEEEAILKAADAETPIEDDPLEVEPEQVDQP